jgi:hypothetical protein
MREYQVHLGLPHYLLALHLTYNNLDFKIITSNAKTLPPEY